MKEIIAETYVRLTEIVKVQDARVDGIINDINNEEFRRQWGDRLKKELGVDDVHVTDITAFVRDLDEVTSFSTPLNSLASCFINDSYN